MPAEWSSHKGDHTVENDASFPTGSGPEEMVEHLFCLDVSGVVNH